MRWAITAQCADNLLGALVDQLQRPVPLDPALRDWLLRGVLHAACSGESLDASLGLSRPGCDSLNRRLRRVRRDAYLVAALDAVALAPLSPWARCERLAPLVRRFVATTWPRARQLHAPLEAWPAWQCEVFRAAKTGVELPTTAKGLHAVLTKAPRFSGSSAGATILARYVA